MGTFWGWWTQLAHPDRTMSPPDCLLRYFITNTIIILIVVTAKVCTSDFLGFGICFCVLFPSHKLSLCFVFTNFLFSIKQLDV